MIVLHLASFQLRYMMIKCAFTQKSSEKLKLFLKNRKCYQTLYTFESPDNDQLFLLLDRHCYKETNHQLHGRDTDLKHRSATCITDAFTRYHCTPLSSVISCSFLGHFQIPRYLFEFSLSQIWGLILFLRKGRLLWCIWFYFPLHSNQDKDSDKYQGR